MVLKWLGCEIDSLYCSKGKFAFYNVYHSPVYISGTLLHYTLPEALPNTYNKHTEENTRTRFVQRLGWQVVNRCYGRRDKDFAEASPCQPKMYL